MHEKVERASFNECKQSIFLVFKGEPSDLKLATENVDWVLSFLLLHLRCRLIINARSPGRVKFLDGCSGEHKIYYA